MSTLKYQAREKAIRWMANQIKHHGVDRDCLQDIKSSFAGSGDINCFIYINTQRWDEVIVELNDHKNVFVFETNILYKFAREIARGQIELFA